MQVGREGEGEGGKEQAARVLEEHGQGARWSGEEEPRGWLGSSAEEWGESAVVVEGGMAGDGAEGDVASGGQVQEGLWSAEDQQRGWLGLSQEDVGGAGEKVEGRENRGKGGLCGKEEGEKGLVLCGGRDRGGSWGSTQTQEEGEDRQENLGNAGKREMGQKRREEAWLAACGGSQQESTPSQ